MARTILLVGSGGREHALAWKILQSPACSRLIVTPGNPGISREGTADKLLRANVRADDVAGLAALAEREHVDLVVCGPEAPLVAGLEEAIVAKNILFFGPSRRAAEVEGSKAFAKDLMARAGVPTAAYGVFSDAQLAEAFIDTHPNALVVKADGLCAGKGVTVCATPSEAKAVVRRMIDERAFGDASTRVVVEEKLVGREASIMGICDGERFVLLASAEDHKAVFDGDLGPNTGGMGTYSPSPLVDEAVTTFVVERIFDPMVKALAADGRPFRGLLYAGLMLTPDRGPIVIEWNCRFGDPETQSVLVRLEDDLVPWLVGAAAGQLPSGPMKWRSEAAVCVVLAAAGYPEQVRTGDVIQGIDAFENNQAQSWVFHSGTAQVGEQLVTAGGRVLGVTALGQDLAAARRRAYDTIQSIQFSGMHYRKDIGARE